MAITHVLPASVDDVFELMTDPQAIVDRGEALGEKDIECEVEDVGRKTFVKSKRTLKRELPKVLAAMFSSENTIVFDEQWERVGDHYLGSYTADVQGQPVKLTAKFSLKPTATGSEYRIEYKCKAGIPLVAKKVEEFIVSQTETGLAAEIDWLKQQLATAGA